ncbi:hypothetical protein [Sandarakinorhabdus sp.]|uniref:hypothetical protein n=1 Tax=Sandarakinorhabdus sp. TaxID=1916663 RepID=UPI00286E7F80|nr:hypothetical protein [Sandarakinorhabdus sp.]
MSGAPLLQHPYYLLSWTTMSHEQRDFRRGLALQWARTVLRPGNQLLVARCGGRSTFTMANWDGHWIVSISGIDDISPLCVLRVNGRDVVNPGLWP